MEVMDPKVFFETFPAKTLYVGFLQFERGWIPLCAVSDPREADKLDTLFVSQSYGSMEELLKKYAGQLPEARQTFVQCIGREEIERLLERYGLKSIAPDATEGAGCGCGCGCG